MTMRKARGVLLVALSLPFFAAALYSLAVTFPVSLMTVLKTGAAYAWGSLTGSILATVLFFLIGRKALKAGRAAFAAAAPQGP